MTDVTNAYDGEVTADWIDAILSTGWLRDYNADADKMVFRFGELRRPEATITVDDGQVTLTEYEGYLVSGESILRGTTEQVCLRLQALLTLAGIQ